MTEEAVEGNDSRESLEEKDTPESAEPPRRRNPLRRLYNWMLHWADTPYGEPALGIISVVESSVFPIPPDPLLIALCLGAAKKSLRFALVATVASVVGGIIGYGIGALAWNVMGDFFFDFVPGVSPESFDRVQVFFVKWGFWAVFLAGLTPIPYKVFTLSSGVFGVAFPIFVVASFLSRGLRFFAVAGLIYRFGEPIKVFIDRYFSWLMWGFGTLFLGGFLVIEMLL